MQAASIAFPIRQTFQRLELEKRWWHRLCVVVFFVVLLGTAVFTAWIAYSVFAPQVATMPDVHVCDVFDQVAAEQQHQNVPDGGCLDISSGLVPEQQSTVDYDASAKRFGGTPVQPMIDAQHTVHQIPTDKVIDALEAGDQRVVDMYAPQGDRGWIPEDKVQAAIKAGFKIAEPVTLDSSKVKPSSKSIQMPDGSNSTFAGTVSDDAIRKQWNHAKTAQILKAIVWAGLLTIAVALFINYFLQGAYRALLYVIFGNNVQTE